MDPSTPVHFGAISYPEDNRFQDRDPVLNNLNSQIFLNHQMRRMFMVKPSTKNTPNAREGILSQLFKGLRALSRVFGPL